MIILGIDPSLAGMGWGVIDTKPLKYLDSGVIKTKSSEAMHKRLAFISSSLQKIIVQYKPTIVAMEETFVNINNVSSLKLGYARGAVMSLIVGYGHAEKNQVLQIIKLLLPGAIAISNFDEADALAVAYVCWAYTSKTPTIEL